MEISFICFLMDLRQTITRLYTNFQRVLELFVNYAQSFCDVDLDKCAIIRTVGWAVPNCDFYTLKAALRSLSPLYIYIQRQRTTIPRYILCFDCTVKLLTKTFSSRHNEEKRNGRILYIATRALIFQIDPKIPFSRTRSQCFSSLEIRLYWVFRRASRSERCCCELNRRRFILSGSASTAPSRNHRESDDGI